MTLQKKNKIIIGKKIIGIIIIGIIIIIIFFFFPVSIEEPYSTTEIFKENYTVVEPRVVQVADWFKENVMVNQPFTDIRYNQKDLKYDAFISSCIGNISYGKSDLAIPEWGQINTISYGPDVYFSGYNKGLLSKDIHTFDKDTKTGHIYNIIKNEKVNITLNEGEYLPLALGYDIQVNKIDNNLKSYKAICDNPEDIDYDPENPCRSSVEYFKGATLSLSDMNIAKTWDVKNGSTLIYEKTLSGGESVPMIAIHINGITNSTVIVDGIFQISNDYVSIPGGLGAEVTVNVVNTDSQSGTFYVYTGFILNSSLGFEIGRINQLFLNPGDSKQLFYTTDRNIEDCRYYVQTSKIFIPENFTNFRNVNFSKRRTEYRNVTLYIDVTKERYVQKNVTKFRNKIVYGLYNIKIKK